MFHTKFSHHIKNKALSKAQQTPDYATVLNDLKNDIMNTLVDTIAKASKTAINEVQANAKSALTNELRERMAVQLANAYINGNRNIIGYLRATYLENTSDAVALYQSLNVGDTADFDARTEFIQAVNSLIQKLDSPEMRELSEREAREALHSFTLNDVLGTEEIVSEETILYHVATTALIELLSGLAEDLTSTIASLISETLTPLTKSGKTAAVVAETIEKYFIKDLLGELLDRCVKGLENNIEKFDPTERGGFSPNIEYWWNSCINEIEDALKMDEFAEYAENKAIDRGLELIKNLLEEPKDWKVDFGKATDSSKQLDGRSGKVEVGKIMLGVTVASFNTVIVPYKTGLLNKMIFMQQKDQDLLEEKLKALEKASKKLAGKLDNESYWDFNAAWISFLFFITEKEQEYTMHSPADIAGKEFMTALNYIYSALKGEGDDPKFEYYRTAHVDTEILTGFMTNSEFWKMLFQSIMYKSIDAEKMMTNAYKADNLFEKHPFDISEMKMKLMNDRKKQAEIRLQNEPGILAVLNMAAKLFEKLWKQAKETGNSFWTAINSIVDAVNGEDEISLLAQRINVTAANSELLSMQLRNYTIGQIRSGAYKKGDYALIRAIDNRSDETTLSYKFMNAEEIKNPKLTPDLNSIKALTDDIMTQVNLDAVGMAAYYSMVKNAFVYFPSKFFTYFINEESILIPEKEADYRLQRIVKFYNDYENSYKSEWNELFD